MQSLRRASRQASERDAGSLSGQISSAGWQNDSARQLSGKRRQDCNNGMGTEATGGQGPKSLPQRFPVTSHTPSAHRPPATRPPRL